MLYSMAVMQKTDWLNHLTSSRKLVVSANRSQIT
jgi:hypothetical protein